MDPKGWDPKGPSNPKQGSLAQPEQGGEYVKGGYDKGSTGRSHKPTLLEPLTIAWRKDLG